MSNERYHRALLPQEQRDMPERNLNYVGRLVTELKGLWYAAIENTIIGADENPHQFTGKEQIMAYGRNQLRSQQRRTLRGSDTLRK